MTSSVSLVETSPHHFQYLLCVSTQDSRHYEQGSSGCGTRRIVMYKFIGFHINPGFGYEGGGGGSFTGGTAH